MSVRWAGRFIVFCCFEYCPRCFCLRSSCPVSTVPCPVFRAPCPVSGKSSVAGSLILWFVLALDLPLLMLPSSPRLPGPRSPPLRCRLWKPHRIRGCSTVDGVCVSARHGVIKFGDRGVWIATTMLLFVPLDGRVGKRRRVRFQSGLQGPVWGVPGFCRPVRSRREEAKLPVVHRSAFPKRSARLLFACLPAR